MLFEKKNEIGQLFIIIDIKYIKYLNSQKLYVVNLNR